VKHRRPDPSFAASIALHVVLGAALAWVLTNPGSLPNWLRHPEAAPPKEERIEYVIVAPRGTAPASRPGRSGGDGRPERPNTPPRSPIAAPSTVPSTVPAPSAGPAPPEGGSGEIIGEGGPARGVRPSFSDPRVWAPPGAVVAVPRTGDEVRDSSLAAALKVYNDSMAALADARQPGDWTVKKNGKRYGLDRGRLYLGDLSVPIPFALQAAPAVAERNRLAERIRAEIEQQSQRAINEEDFRTAVRRIRERKERERRERGRDNAPEAVATSPDEGRRD
jgi:hypothetical protein